MILINILRFVTFYIGALEILLLTYLLTYCSTVSRSGITNVTELWNLWNLIEDRCPSLDNADRRRHLELRAKCSEKSRDGVNSQHVHHVHYQVVGKTNETETDATTYRVVRKK